MAAERAKDTEESESEKETIEESARGWAPGPAMCWVPRRESVPLDLVNIFVPKTNRHLGECSENNTNKAVRYHLLFDMKETNTQLT